MKLREAGTGRTYFGETALDVVMQLFKSCHGRPVGIDQYMKGVAKRIAKQQMTDVDIVMDGDTLEERCQSFLSSSVAAGLFVDESK